MVKVYAPKKPLKFHPGVLPGRGGDPGHLGCQGDNPASRHSMPKESDRRLVENTLFSVDCQARRAQTVEKGPNMFDMGGGAWTSHQDIVQVHKEERHILQNAVHQALERLG